MSLLIQHGKSVCVRQFSIAEQAVNVEFNRNTIGYLASTIYSVYAVLMEGLI